MQLLANEAFGKGDEFRLALVRFPADTSVIEDLEDHSAQRTSEGLDAITCFPIGGFAETIDDVDHAFAIEHARDVVGNGGGNLPPTTRGKFSKNQSRHLPTYVCEGVTVEEQEWSGTMTATEEVDRLL